MSPEITRALANLAKTRQKLQRGGPGAEAAYAQAYRRLVGLGHYPQLRAKYRL